MLITEVFSCFHFCLILVLWILSNFDFWLKQLWCRTSTDYQGDKCAEEILNSILLSGARTFSTCCLDVLFYLKKPWLLQAWILSAAWIFILFNNWDVNSLSSLKLGERRVYMLKIYLSVAAKTIKMLYWSGNIYTTQLAPFWQSGSNKKWARVGDEAH